MRPPPSQEYAALVTWGPALEEAGVETEIRSWAPTKQGGTERMKRYLAALLVVLGVVGLVGVLAVGTGVAKNENAAGAQCSKATLHGKYLFAFDGVNTKGKPFAFAGYQEYNGKGKVKAVLSLNYNGNIQRNTSISGTYTVKADCTSTVTYKNGVRFDQFIAPDGSMLTFVQTAPRTDVLSGFEQRGTAKRVAPWQAK
jgi:hypothetical protein